MRIRLLYSLLLLLALCGCLDSSLLDNPIDSGKTVPVQLVLSLNEQTPVTRSSFADFNAITIHDVNILIYSNDGNQLADIFYYHNLNYDSNTSTNLNLMLNTAPGLHKIYVVANWGGSMEGLNVPTENNIVTDPTQSLINVTVNVTIAPWSEKALNPDFGY